MNFLIALLLTFAVPQARAQPAPPPQQQKGVGPTGTMFDGNNLTRFPLARPAPADPTRPAATTAGVTGAQGSRDEGSTGAGGGEH